ncbi:filamentous hemagglutinin N-terminal domain-containing protein [Candidatus Halobeggiatoa sp. HSG11]|nr:filamentous hemagglutinin N-terminal domain-containing protein [Candidatus Halobeggiatoa sp. HSG11]
MKYLPIASLLIITLSTNAEVITDGTLGQNINLPGPDFQIGADLGQQYGSNLFHSFQDFNLNSSESATFSGLNSINNVISRVTGGNPSNIDGQLRSTIPNADMYFLNPYGIMFGPNAQLNIQGSFHASTADYLRLGNGGRFDARNPSDSLLTVAPVESFGFLTDTPAPITTQDSNLSVSNSKTLSLIGGDLELNGSSPVVFNEGNFMAISARSILSAQGGRINLASAASKGEIIPSESGLKLNAEGGQINMDKTLIETSDAGSGAVFIRGGQLVMRDAAIQANTMGGQNGKVIDLKLGESINISEELPAILSKSFGSGDAGNVVITTPRLKIIGSYIETSNVAQGDGGSIDVDSKQVKITDGGSIGCSAFGSGQCGDVNIRAAEFISILGEHKGIRIYSGTPLINYPTYIATTAYNGDAGQLNIEASQINMAGGFIASGSLGLGDAGDITIRADTINVTDGSFIANSGLALGRVGNIDINVTDTISLSGRRTGSYITTTGVEFEDNQSSIVSFGLASSGGNISISASTLKVDNEAFISASTLGGFTAETIGNINLEVDNLFITQGGQINNSNGVFLGRDFFAGPGQGGDIQVQAKNITIDADKSGLPTGIFSDTYSSENGGNVDIQTNNLDIANDGAISARSNDTGNAGSLTIQADTVKLINQGKVNTEAENAAGGNILINTPNLLFLQKGEITTSVGAGKGKGGDITIENPQFVVLNQGKIKAQADAGHGGNIHIVAEQFITSPNSLISASSNLGLDGDVNIESLNVDMEGFLVVLSDKVVDVSNQMKTPCGQRLAENLNSFVVISSEGAANSPDDLLPSGPLLSENLPMKTAISVKNLPDKLAFSTCKK